MTTAVTVVIATRNRAVGLTRTLDRLRSLPEQPPVIVVDNGSTDDSAAAVRRRHPDVTVIELGENLGAVARTVGVRASTTPYVAFCDDDSWWEPGALTRAAGHLDAHPRIGLLAARIRVGPERRLDPVCAMMADSPLGTEPDLPGPSVLGFVACGAIVRRDAYLAIGGFSPVVFFFGEETVLAQDLAAAGWARVYVDDVVATHDPAPGGDRSGRRRLLLRNVLLSTWLRRRWPALLATTGHAIRDISDADVRGALLDAAARLPAVVRARRALPRHVEEAVQRLELLQPPPLAGSHA
ncbi:glycosyl transferase [Intrasporangium chromatireducens Q5-1]|uniref:Glycosyl transferase n=1 Tax=Intrasporangium chromatireducens Q5-1 TaxID=584657 RepID=W9GEB1_9MICO|nr:glycosyltransferase [Intrasporangium chromatireducens]EWT04521.1 glycosyl transferase [Intrasporangium chromatireducens Q5-1]